jgi:hypothetical protein
MHNLFPLNEYSQGEMKFLMDKFKEEAEDLNIQISDEQLKKYIERFDQLKNNPKVTDKDLRKYSLSKLIQLVTSSPGAELSSDEKEDDTPDVVYNDNGITIWNGAKQGNCIVYGASQKLPGGSKWCITEPGGSYFGRYRYGADYDYPTFYLAKNSNLPDNDRLSFVSLQVLKGGDYKFTNRANSPGMEGPFSWEELNRRVPWLRNIPNLKNTLKYIPFSKSEKESEVFKRNPISIKQWIKEPFNVKKQYLLIRAGDRQLFSDISNDLFISKYLPQYSEIANTVARTAGIIDVNLLMKYLDKFSKQDQSSIAQQIREKVELKTLEEDISFDLKKYLVKTNKVELKPEQRLYVTKDNQSIVLLTFEDNSVKVGLYTEDDYYPNIKLNQRTSKYLLEYPELDKVPLRNLIKLAEDNVVSKEFIGDVLDKAKKDPNSALIVKPTEEGEIILDSNTFSSYRVGSDGKISSIPFDNEEVQQVLSNSKDNEALQQNALNLFTTREDLPRSIDKRSLVSIINSIPYNQRIIPSPGIGSAVLLTNAEADRPFFLMNSNLTGPFYKVRGNYNTEGRFNGYGDVDDSRIPAYHAYLRSINKSFSDAELMEIFRSTGIPIESKVAIVRNNMPVSTDTVYKPVMNNNDVVLVNTGNSRESLMLSRSRNNLKQFNIPQQFANQLLGIAAPAAAAQPAADGAARRGRPAGQPNAPRPAAAPAAAGDLSLSTVANQYNLTPGFNTLPNSILRKFRVNGRQLPVANDRGATRRQNILGNSGRVIAVYEFGPSSIYIIRLANNTTVASVVAQPGNSHYIITNNNSYQLNSPSALLQVLQQRNLAEIHQYLVNEYMGRNPKHLNEFKELLRKHINEKKNEQK